MMRSTRLRSLLAPSTVAVVGASDNPATFGGRTWKYLTRTYRGTAVPVNPRIRAIGDVACVPTLQDVDPAPEAVILMTPASTVIGLLEQAGAMGTRAAVIFSRDLLGREAEIRAAARQSEMSVLGPNCLGLINTNDGVVLSSSISLERPSLPGPFAFVSQSGALMGVLHARSLDLGIGLGLCVSTGSQAVVRTEDILMELADYEGIRGVAVYLEDLDASRFAAAAARLAECGVRLVAMKSGSTEMGSEMTAAHSRALASSGRAFSQFARDLGVVLVDDPNQFLPTLAATSTHGRRWHVVTSSGALSAIAADEATTLGLELPPTGVDAIAAAGMLVQRNPTDLDAMSSTTTEKVEAIRALANDAGVDGVLVVVNDSPDLEELVPALRAVCGNGLGRVLVASECSQQFASLWVDWTAGGSVVFPGLSATLRALARVHPSREGHKAPHGRSESLLSPMELQALLLDVGMPILPIQEVESAEAARDWADRVGYPVVLKVSRATHRGPDGLRLDLRSPKEVTTAYQELVSHGPVLVQAQSPSGLEFYVAVRMDPVFGQLVLIGAGGPNVEAMADVVIGRPPMQSEELRQLVDSTLVGKWLASQTSKSLFNLDSLVHVAELAMRVVTGAEPRLETLDLNPVIVHASGATVIDAKAGRSPSPKNSTASSWSDEVSHAHRSC